MEPASSGDGTVARMNAEGPDFDALVSRALDGDRDATEELLAVIRPLVVRYCRARVKADGATFERADALAHDACIGVLTSLPRFPEQDRPFLPFVYEIAQHVVAQDQRRSGR